jgi:hypothetical protein
MLALCTLGAVGADAASAATVKVQGRYEKAAYVGDGIYFQAVPGEANDVTMVQEGNVVTVTDRVPLEPGPACGALSAFQVRCTLNASLSVLLDARLGDGDDALRVAGVDAFSARLLGGPGADHLVGLANGETRFSGGPGNDVMEGGTGGDTFIEDAERNGSDTMLGGPPGTLPAVLSDDAVDYGLRRHPVRVSLNGARDDGERGERDQIGTDVERVVAGSAPDLMLGNALANQFVGGPGRDLLRGGAGDDHLVGDEYVARPKREGDVIRGGAGDDRIEGGLGADRISGGPGHDAIVAGPGADRLRTGDGVLDAVLCGTARDRVLPDASDFLAFDCERQGSRIPARVVPLFWADGGDRLFLALGCPFHRDVTCEAEATLEVGGQAFGPRSFSLASGRYAWLLLSLGGERTHEHPDPPLDGGVLVLRSADPRGRVATVRIPLSAVHRDPTEVSFFLPPVLPFL